MYRSTSERVWCGTKDSDSLNTSYAGITRIRCKGQEAAPPLISAGNSSQRPCVRLSADESIVSAAYKFVKEIERTEKYKKIKLRANKCNAASYRH